VTADHAILVVEVRFLDGRYHGTPEWPPSPARLFQALVAGAGPALTADDERALRWLEALPPPDVASPPATRGQKVRLYVPNNDLDAKGGDPAEVASIRTIKWVHPHLFDAAVPLAYRWSIGADDEGQALAVCALAQRLYQLGRGVDVASARGRVLAAGEPWAHPAAEVHRPTPGGVGGRELAVPTPGSFDSLVARFDAVGQRFEVVGTGRQATQVFVQPPKPRFATAMYDAVAARRLFELRPIEAPDRFAVCPLGKVSPFVVEVRDAAASRLKEALGARTDDIERVVVGRSPDGRSVPKEDRVRIVPLPSIGHTHADRGIRRVLVEAPSGGPLPPEDVLWAFSGLEVAVGAAQAVLTPSADLDMLGFYAATRESARTWRTVTPAALPEAAARRRIEPTRLREEAKGGAEREQEEGRAVAAVVQALRHAEVRTPVAAIRVQREPFEGGGERAESFAPDTRFAKERLWHVELTFAEPVGGPLVLGDGRFLGLGLLAPVRPAGVYAFAADGLAPDADPEVVARALRRAVMARVQAALGDRELPTYFSGHAEDGAPARREEEPHLLFLFDPEGPRLLVVAPHAAQRRDPWPAEERRLALLEKALADLRELRAGAAGLLTLRPLQINPSNDGLFAPATAWETATPYLVTRHAKRVDPAEIVRRDLAEECRRAGLPEPRSVTPRSWSGISGVGLVARIELEFPVAVPGPVVLGRSRHRGGGLFRRANRAADRG
jgi:CRISPR-associated protein Csb2